VLGKNRAIVAVIGRHDFAEPEMYPPPCK